MVYFFFLTSESKSTSEHVLKQGVKQLKQLIQNFCCLQGQLCGLYMPVVLTEW